MKRLPLFVLFFSLASFFACDRDSESVYDFTYPVAQGYQWQYQREIEQINADSADASPQRILIDTVFSAFTDQVVLRDSMDAFLLTIHSASNPDVMSYNYYQQKSDGLFLVAYRDANALIVLPKTAGQTHILFKGRSYANIGQLVNVLLNPSSMMKTSDSLYFEDAPVQAYKYPLKVGAQWTYRQYGHPFRIEKRIVDTETIATPAGSFHCFKIQFLYDMDQDQQWDEDLGITDLVAKEGIIKRSVVIKGVKQFDEEGNLIDQYDFHETYTLIEYELKEVTGSIAPLAIDH